MKKNKKLKVKKINLNKKQKKKKKRRIRYKRIIIALVVLGLIVYLLANIFSFPVKNIYIYNNNYLTDQEIIDIAGLTDYPSIFSKITYQMENQLEENIYIKEATVEKVKLSRINITVKENRPLFYDLENEKTLFEDGQELEENIGVATLINYVPDTIYDSFIQCMKKIDTNVLEKISEIKYDPNEVDEERFLLTMTDGNYIYINIKNYDKLNSYINIYADIIETYGYKKGILYLDSGEYFEVIN